MFDTLNNTSYRNIITNIGIIGYEEEDIINWDNDDYNKIPLNCLYAFPLKNEAIYNSLTYEMMFPDGDRFIECPKFFSLSLTNEKAHHSFLYCLKFSEKFKYKVKNDKENVNILKKTKSNDIFNIYKYKEMYIPIVICIQSDKNDSEPFRKILYNIHQIIINDNFDNEKSTIIDYKKIELMNLLYFLFSLPHTSPHTQINLKINYNINNINENENNEFDIIDFYFSSNCEIPCNRSNSNIDLLFTILDQTIILKVLLAILTEKQIILRASEAYLLHIIIPTFLQLIFPFVWIQTCITILPKENIGYLDLPGTYIIGILSSTIPIKEIIKEYPGKIIVDCDTNEIIGEEISIPYYPEENNNNKKEEKQLKNNEIKTINYGMVQGKNTFLIDGCYLYEYDQNNNNNKNKKKLKIKSNKNIIIDIQNSQLLVNKNDSYINSEEWKWLRKNIQMVRNPEIFGIDNIGKRKHSVINVFFDSAKESPIIAERPFSYNIQNILMTFLLNKLEYKESDFMTYFKQSNLYLNYNEPKKYQNNAGKYIVDNIKKTKNNQRSCNNCFLIEYELKPFNANFFLEDLDKKIIYFEKEHDINKSENTNDYSKYNSYKKIKKIIAGYCLIYGISLKQMNDITNDEINKKNNSIRKTITRTKINNYKYSSKNNYFYFNTYENNNIKEHIKNKKSAFNLYKNDFDNDNDNDEEDDYLLPFYGENGFINFITNFETYLKNENIDIKNIIYQNSINNQIIHIFKDLKKILRLKDSSKIQTKISIDILDDVSADNNNSSDDENDSNSNNNSIIYHKISSTKKLMHRNSAELLEEIKSISSSKNLDKSRMSSIIEEKKDEDDSFLEGMNIIKKSTQKISNYEYDLEYCINNNNVINLGEETTYNNIHNNNKGDIIKFLDFNYEKEKILEIYEEKDKNKINNNNDDKIDLLLQYYLFLNYHLEDISKDEIMKKKVIDEIKKEYNIKINLDKLILKLYKLAFDHSGKGHRDFPYFNFYEFLMGLSLDNLIILENNIDKFQLELYDIYNYVCKEKKKELTEEKRKSTLKDIYLTPALKGRTSSTDNIEHKSEFVKKNTLPNAKMRASLVINLNKNEFLKKVFNKEETNKKNEIEDSTIFKISKEYIINNSSDFDPLCEPGSTHILHELCVLISTCLPSTEDIKNKNLNEILEETNIKLNTQTFKELIGELRNIDLKQLKNNKSKMCFWLNCFNFLLLYTIFYKKWKICDEKSWKSFLKNVKYIIGGNQYSFNDIQYIIFKKLFFFSSGYKPGDAAKKNVINQKLKSIDNNPFCLYIPTNEFLKPIIFEEDNLEKDLLKRKINYIFSFIRIDNKKINISELFLNYEPNFFNIKIVNKYKDILDRTIYDIIIKKQYSDISTKNLKWEMSFDFLYKEVIEPNDF